MNKASFLRNKKFRYGTTSVVLTAVFIAFEIRLLMLLNLFAMPANAETATPNELIQELTNSFEN